MKEIIVVLVLWFLMGIPGYFVLRDRVKLVHPVNGAIFATVLTLLNGILSGIATGNWYWLRTFGISAVLAGPIMYIMLRFVHKSTERTE